ncbi:MAG: metalloregulator ArsR/SmtB family transcription factor [Lachnospiraceae bacterium]|nr:metalloregulator ArsR/SmtB family transcription factor [Lachnospiraceae bacterium]
MYTKEDIETLAKDFEKCHKVLIALGDENRQHLILEMMKMEVCYGARVGDITDRTHFSRPAVSHHLQILKNAGILKMRKEGTKNYYYFDPDTNSFDRLISVLQRAKSLTAELPDRSGEK